MTSQINFKKFSFLVYWLGASGLSVIRYLKKKGVTDLSLWDDNSKFKNKFKHKKTFDLNKRLQEVDFIVLSPGISLKKTKHRKKLINLKKKIITDIDLLYLSDLNFKSIVVTGTNGKSTTCKIIAHLLKKNNFNVELGGNIGTPVLNLNVKKSKIFVIEASSFQLSHSKFIKPNYAILLNITNDHLDWHGSMNNYINSKLKIFNLQKKNNYAIINKKLKNKFKSKKFVSKLIFQKINEYQKIKVKIQNDYLKSVSNDENMSFVYTLSKLIKINKKSFISSINSFVGLPHRFEIFLKKKNITFVNDSKATSFQAAKLALMSCSNIYWILGGQPKLKDKIILKEMKKNIIKAYVIGRNSNFFKNQLKNKINFTVTKNLKVSIIKILKEIRFLKNKKFTVLLSPSAASFDQYVNFESRGNEFKKLSKKYANKFIKH